MVLEVRVRVRVGVRVGVRVSVRVRVRVRVSVRDSGSGWSPAALRRRMRRERRSCLGQG